MKKIFVLLISMFLIIACEKTEDDPTPTTKSSAKSIVNFSISGINAVIDENTLSIELYLSSSANLASLSPKISISSKATISPASDEAQDFTNPVTYTVTAEDGTKSEYNVTVYGECVGVTYVHAFSFKGKNYELISLNRKWEHAASCAVERGGYLAEINSNEENEALFKEITVVAQVDPNKTVASDGGSASYIWLGGNDAQNEGAWVWDGHNDKSGIQFWQGDASGKAVDNLYNNWGIEPDDFNNQDGLGIGITQWPINTGSLGNPGQWNDIKLHNNLYYLIEYD